MKLRFTILILCAAVLAVLLCADVSAQRVSECAATNGAFMDPYWVMFEQDEAQLALLLQKMRQYRIRYQFIDCGYFDKDYLSGEMNEIDASIFMENYAALDEWLDYFSEYAPEIERIASINGSSELHLRAKDKQAVFKRIADYCVLLLEKGAQGINLDFEPVRPEYRREYIELLRVIRGRIGEDVPLSVCVSPLIENLPNADARAYAAFADMLVLMDYDTAASSRDAKGYIQLIADNAYRISRAIRFTKCRVLPLGPGYYGYTEYHPPYENAENHAAAIKLALQKGATFAGSGIWWFRGVMENEEEERMYLENWIGNQS